MAGSSSLMSEIAVDETDDNTEISNLSDAQEIALSLLPIPSSILSIIGSSTIIYLVLFNNNMRSKNNNHRRSNSSNSSSSSSSTYRRILLGMSICDLIISTAWACSGFLMPSDSSQRVWAFGNDATCTALGFLTQFGFSGFLYYGALSYYYVLTIRWGMRDARFSKCLEPIMHVICIGYPLATAFFGVGLGIFYENELGIGCWINNYPDNCGSGPNETGEPCMSSTIAWLIGGTVILFILASLLVNNIVIYVHVRRTITRSRRRHFTSTVVCSAAAERRTSTAAAGRGTRISHAAQQQADDDSQMRRIRAVAAQCFLYVAAFVVSYSWGVVVRILEGMGYDAKDEASIYALLVGQAVFGPLPGWFNLMIYLRPRYLRIRNDFGEQQVSRWWAVKRALLGEQVVVVSRNTTENRTNTPPAVATRENKHESNVTTTNPTATEPSSSSTRSLFITPTPRPAGAFAAGLMLLPPPLHNNPLHKNQQRINQ